jgi:hypothetical protein
MIKELLKCIFWMSPWGKCVILKAWFNYRESPLWQYRVEALGHLPAAKMLTMKEFKHFVNKTLNDVDFLKSIIYPYTKLNDMAEKDLFYRQEITFLKG